MNALLFARLAQPACFYGGVTPPFKTKRIVELDWGHPMGGSARLALDQFAWLRLPKCRASPAKLFCMRCSHPNKKTTSRFLLGVIQWNGLLGQPFAWPGLPSCQVSPAKRFLNGEITPSPPSITFSRF